MRDNAGYMRSRGLVTFRHHMRTDIGKGTRTFTIPEGFMDSFSPPW